MFGSDCTEGVFVMIEIDARGLSCPVPVVKAKKALDGNPDECRVLVDTCTQVENVTRLAESAGYEVKVEHEGDTYKLIITRKGSGDA